MYMHMYICIHIYIYTYLSIKFIATYKVSRLAYILTPVSNRRFKLPLRNTININCTIKISKSYLTHMSGKTNR